MLAENFGIDWLKVDVPFQCEVHWLRPRAEPQRNRFSVLVAHTEPDAYSLSDNELKQVATKFDLIVVKKNRFNLPNAIEDCFGSTWLTDSPKRKEFGISYLLSAGNHKGVLPGYTLRLEVVLGQSRIKKIPQHFYKSKYFDAHNEKFSAEKFEIALPPLPNDNRQSLFDYMFNIAIENSQEENYFTEKIVDCFRARTIPIYNGCPNIADYFDEKGIIRFADVNELIDKVNNLTQDEYYERYKAMAENYELAAAYYDPWKRLAKNIIRYRN